MPLDPNAPTSDIGMMYRQYLQSKGMPLTAENMQRVVSQSQREPGMIAGLSVQQPGGMSAEAPPNLAGASPMSSGRAMPTPPAVPTGIPPSSPLRQENEPPSMPPGRTDSGPAQLPYMKQVEPQSPQAPPQQDTATSPIGNILASSAQAQPAQPPQTPPPGQPPAADQTGGQGQPLPDWMVPAATALGPAAIAALLMRNRGAVPPAPPAQPQPPGSPIADAPAGVTSSSPITLDSVGVRPNITPPTSHPSVMPSAQGMHPNVMPNIPPAGAPAKPPIPQTAQTTAQAILRDEAPAFVRRGGALPQQGPVSSPGRSGPTDDGVSIPKPSEVDPRLMQPPPGIVGAREPVGPITPVPAIPPRPLPMSPVSGVHADDHPMISGTYHDEATAPIENILRPKTGAWANEGVSGPAWRGEGKDVSVGQGEQSNASVASKIENAGKGNNYPGATPMDAPTPTVKPKVRARGVRGLRL